MDSFFSESVAEVKQEVASKNPKKKRKLEEKKDDLDELKQKARLYCACSEQWKIISKYNGDKLKAWVDEKEFEQTKKLHETVFNFVQRAIGFGLDAVMHGENYINTEVQNDVSLRQALEIEAGNWLAFLSNRFKILALLGSDIANGKITQRENSKPASITVIEQNHDGGHESIEPGVKEEVASGEVSGDLGEALDCDPKLAKRQWQDNGSCEPAL
jgi:hypothetical protein